MSQVDVIVPCYNYARYLRECVESVLSQTGVDVRVLILDDASPDDTPAVAASLTAQDRRVTYRRHSVNRGHIATYNHGLEWIEGDYAMLLSADDLLTPGALGRAARVMDDHPEVGMTYGRGVRLLESETPAAHQLQAVDGGVRIIPGPDYIRLVSEKAQNPIPTPSVVVRTSLQRRLGGYLEWLPHTGDMEMWMRFAAHSSLAEVDADQAFYRIHGRNMHLNDFGTKFAELAQRKLAFDTLFQNHGSLLPEAPRLMEQVGSAVASDALFSAYTAFYQGDSPNCRNLLELAVQSDPRATSSPYYHRVQWLLRLGLPLTLLARRLFRKPMLPTETRSAVA